MEESYGGKPSRENPKQFLHRIRDKNVSVTLKWGQVYEGVLVTSDNYFNILLDKCIEKDGESEAMVGEVTIRCNNIKSIAES
ncbi:small nuclear ribonucleoprotein F [Encephalitozoon intestinalis ATCC 50506]|uniref:Sm protein F n=1 Tax=Encephalitozoon intestinalis (strain ATCC 50506) TaxID=876142 RepID=E0S6M9_ENCIT|nr:small nuclear ribonucleoprotein F [Encephalitozoon intestinalis ATCC 50506]ADM11364.1 small nuclear ribonucleoprotein F [Encephalitozoon intestinalis ATCC 50506]UTX45054.1 small nuclear ribonucleoprotein F [Encephalitozoon intestinalis]